MPANKRDLQALHYLAVRLRTETYGAGKWDDNGITAILDKLEGRNLASVIEQVTRHAADPEAKTPGAILRPFVPGPPSLPVSRPPKPHEECRTHPGSHADNCSGCAADQLAGETRPPARGQGSPPPDAWAAARAAMKPHTPTSRSIPACEAIVKEEADA